ncbi:uncharacterized protein CC84DRAFT_1143268 [Paraphaeosphaeria sporulosa]|uniref:Uncharacterized protein n=1 Tax=Paraphaeosphaeria sporulosa TaxID=1460663 RepID=A0A177CJ69_9PLEO|nr:uncharacterized protein CC84DRAFT_1143268 [Paraphaeosphaeria sporulosa]OAG07022.1 hypothetical protein CC84DRAFT_1143268 [Paraphaeosphaeria sporulosa]
MDGGDLSAITSSRFWKAGGHFTPSSNAGPEHSSPLAPRDLRPLRPRNGYGNGYGHGHPANPFAGNGYRSSRTWVSSEAQLHQEFVIIRNAMRRLFKNSEVAKWKLQDYTAHKEGILASKKAALDRALKQKEIERAVGAIQPDPKRDFSISKLIPESNLCMEGNLSRVLGMKTIWCKDWKNGKDEVADWPTLPEMKWEGDDRAKTACGRFLPLPREEGAPGIPWGQLQVIEQYPLDQVQCIPTMEDIYLPVDEIEEGDIPQLLNQELLDALDESL